VQQGRTDRAKEVKEMTKYYLQMGRYFLSLSALTGFGLLLKN
jgi:hypothetical protein